jgi:hypothetical protein
MKKVIQSGQTRPLLWNGSVAGTDCSAVFLAGAFSATAFFLLAAFFRVTGFVAAGAAVFLAVVSAGASFAGAPVLVFTMVLRSALRVLSVLLITI